MGNDVDRVFSGFVLTLIHGRARFGDTLMLTGEPFLDLDDGGVAFMELQAVETKVSNKKDRRRKALPIVCLSHGISGGCWVVHWLAVRAKLGMNAAEAPLMPSINKSGTFGKARLKTHEAVVWLRELLIKVGAPAMASQLIGTHSAKCTVLSWAAKAGLGISCEKAIGLSYVLEGGDSSDLQQGRLSRATHGA